MLDCVLGGVVTEAGCCSVTGSLRLLSSVVGTRDSM